MRGRALRWRLLPAALALGAASAATAADWSVSGALSQRFTLDPDPNSEENVSLGASTTFGFDVTAQTPTTVWRIAPGFSASFFSDSDSNVDSVNDVSPRFSGSVSHQSARWTVSGTASVVPRQTSFSQFGDEELDPGGVIDRRSTEGDAIQIAGNVGLNVSYALDLLNSLSVGLSGRIREYTEDTTDLRATRSVGTTLSWSRTLSPTTTGSLSTGFTRFTAEGREDTDSLNVNLGLSQKVNTRISVNGSGGLSFSRGGGLSGDESDTVDVGFDGGFGASYAINDRINFSLNARQSVEQDELGVISNRISVGANLSNEIDSQSGLSFSTRFSTDNPLLDDEESEDGGAVVLSATYRLALSTNWSLQSGYRYRVELEDTDQNSELFVSFSRGLVFLD